MRRLLPLFVVFTLLPAAASALTVQEVVALSKAGVSEDVLLAMIDRDKTIFPIDAAQLIALKRDGVSEKIVIAMLRSGREEPPPPAEPPAEVLAAAAAGPTLLIVGHGPDRPNTYHSFDALGMPRFVYPLYPLYPSGALYPVAPSITVPTVPSWARSAVTCGAGTRSTGQRKSGTDAADCRYPSR